MQTETRGRPARGGAVRHPNGFDDDAAADQSLQVPADRLPACLAAFAELSGRLFPPLGQATNKAEPDGIGDDVEKTCKRREGRLRRNGRCFKQRVSSSRRHGANLIRSSQTRQPSR